MQLRSLSDSAPCTLNHIKQTAGHQHGPVSDHVHCNNIMAKCPEIHPSGHISAKRVENCLLDALVERMKAVSA